MTAVLDGTIGNGEKGENDFINHDVESVASGGDTLDADDNLRGEVRCGGGADVVTVDPDDRVNADCENVTVAARGTRCTAQTRGLSACPARSSPRVLCFRLEGTLRLASVARVRTGKGARAGSCGSGTGLSTSRRDGRTVTVRSSRQARSLIRSKKRLSVRAQITSKATTQRRAVRTIRVLTVRARGEERDRGQVLTRLLIACLAVAMARRGAGRRDPDQHPRLRRQPLRARRRVRRSTPRPAATRTRTSTCSSAVRASRRRRHQHNFDRDQHHPEPHGVPAGTFSSIVARVVGVNGNLGRTASGSSSRPRRPSPTSPAR